MKSIGDFFKRIGTVQAREMLRREAVQSAIKEFIGIDVPITDISFKSQTAVLKGVSHTAKSTIFLKKKQIIEKVRQIYPDYILEDIR